MARLRWWRWICALPLVSGQETADLLSFDLRGGLVGMTLGVPGQAVELLAGFYASGVAVRVPSCEAGEGWSPIVSPSKGMAVETDVGEGALLGMTLVQWEVSSDAAELNVGLRKGGKNVSVIECELASIFALCRKRVGRELIEA